MSLQYDLYLEEHKKNVAEAFDWLKQNLPEVVEMEKMPYPGYGKPEVDLEHQVCYAHDSSKTTGDEYYPYDAYFYGGNRSHQVVQDFNMAWLKHIHRNPHHWQYWVLINDDPEEGEIVLPMPYNYIVEMICDWWSFSFRTGNLHEIFKWYDAHKAHMKLAESTREKVEGILAKIREKLDSLAERVDVEETEIETKESDSEE